MPIIEKKTRKSTNQIGDLLKSLYEDVLLLCENDEIKLKNTTRSKRWKQFVESSQINISYSSKSEKGKFDIHKISKKDVLVIAPNCLTKDINDAIIFTSTTKKVFYSLFVHIRNAFAHNQIFMYGSHVVMYDMVIGKSDKFTMIAHVKVSVLKELIKTIKLISEIK